MILIKTDRKTVPATRFVPLCQDGQARKKARQERVALLAEARKQPDVDVITSTYLEPGATILHCDGQGEPVIVYDMPKHACCPPPTKKGRIYPVCGMDAWACAETLWWW